MDIPYKAQEGTAYRLVRHPECGCTEEGLSVGNIVYLSYDDGTSCPYFVRDKEDIGERTFCIYWNDLEPVAVADTKRIPALAVELKQEAKSIRQEVRKMREEIKKMQVEARKLEAASKALRDLG